MHHKVNKKIVFKTRVFALSYHEATRHAQPCMHETGVIYEACTRLGYQLLIQAKDLSLSSRFVTIICFFVVIHIQKGDKENNGNNLIKV